MSFWMIANSLVICLQRAIEGTVPFKCASCKVALNCSKYQALICKNERIFNKCNDVILITVSNLTIRG